MSLVLILLTCASSICADTFSATTPTLRVVAKPDAYRATTPTLRVVAKPDAYRATTPTLRVVAKPDAYRATTPTLRVVAKPDAYRATTPTLRVVAKPDAYRATTPTLRVVAKPDAYRATTPTLRVVAKPDAYRATTPTLRVVAKPDAYRATTPTLRVVAKPDAYRATTPTLRVVGRSQEEETDPEEPRADVACDALRTCFADEDILREEANLRVLGYTPQTDPAFCQNVAQTLGGCVAQDESAPPMGVGGERDTVTVTGGPPEQTPDGDNAPSGLNFNRCPPLEDYAKRLQLRSDAGEDTDAEEQHLMLIITAAAQHLLNGRADRYCEQITANLP